MPEQVALDLAAVASDHHPADISVHRIGIALHISDFGALNVDVQQVDRLALRQVRQGKARQYLAVGAVAMRGKGGRIGIKIGSAPQLVPCSAATGKIASPSRGPATP